MSDAETEIDAEAAKIEHAHPFIALVFLMTALISVVAALDVTSLQEPEFMRDLDMSAETAGLLTTLFAALLGASLVPVGDLGDVYGRKRLFLISGAVVVLVSVLGAFAWAAWVVIVVRCLQGFAAGGMVSTAVGLVNAGFPKGHRRRGLAFAIWGSAFGIGLAVGMLVGGGLGWRAAFGVEAAIAFVGLLGVVPFVGESERKSETIDYGGSILLTIGLVALILALDEGSYLGYLEPIRELTIGGTKIDTGLSLVFWLFIVAGISLTALVFYDRRRSKRDKSALLDPELFESSRFTRGLITAFLWTVGAFAYTLVLPQYLQLSLGFSGFELAATMLPIGIAWAISAAFSGVLGDRIGARDTTILGMAISAVALFIVVPLTSASTSSVVLLGPLALLGIGMGFTYARISDVVLVDVPALKSSVGGGVLVTARIAGVGIGTALIVAILVGTALSDATSAIESDASLDPAEQQVAIDDVDSIVHGTQGKSSGAHTAGESGRSGGEVNEALADSEAQTAVEDGFASGTRLTTLIGGGVLVVAIGIGFTIPSDRPKRETSKA